jgi:hypothetical protein
MKQFLLITLSIFNILYIHSQNKFIDSTKIYVYKAIFINSNGDTLTKEKMIIHPLEKPWWIQKTQKTYEIQYFPDSIGLLKYKSYSPKIQKKIDKLIKLNSLNFWFSKNEITGGITDSFQFEIFLHPPRSNQYEYIQLAPFPVIYKGALNKETSMEYNYILHYYGSIPPTAGKFKGEYKGVYKTSPIKFYKSGNLNWENCWEIKALNTHKKIPPNYLDAVYNKNDGFLILHYRFFDKTQIIILLENILSIKSTIK